MSTIDEFYRMDCEKLDPQNVNAYFDYRLDDIDPTKLKISNSWGDYEVDLTPAIKAGETVTTLQLDPTTDPEYLRFNREDGGADCIHGDDLSRIISMKYLKDVDQNDRAPRAGDIYMLGSDGLFHLFNLQDFMDDVNARLSKIEGDMYWDGVPANTKVAWGNRNVYGDKTNTGLRTHGVFTHPTSQTLTDDMYFA